MSIGSIADCDTFFSSLMVTNAAPVEPAPPQPSTSLQVDTLSPTLIALLQAISGDGDSAA